MNNQVFPAIGPEAFRRQLGVFDRMRAILVARPAPQRSEVAYLVRKPEPVYVFVDGVAA